MQKKIGTLSEMIKLSDEEIEALPKAVKFIKHTILDSEKSDDTKRVSDALQKIVDLDKLEFDLTIEDPTSYGMALCLALATTSISKTVERNEKKELEEENKRLQEKAATLTKELVEKDEELKRLRADRDLHSYTWRGIRPSDDEGFDAEEATRKETYEDTNHTDSKKVDIDELVNDLFKSGGLFNRGYKPYY